MPSRFPAIEPYQTGMLDVSDGHRLHWECCGNPNGKPALVLHGGPGSGCTAGLRRLFDPARYRVVLFDQRNCGRSTPHASEPSTDLSTNTTAHLVADIEKLRQSLKIERWLVYGVSWGVTLGLAYAEHHRERVSAMVLSSVTMTRPSEIRWLYHDIGKVFPEAWARFRAGAGGDTRDLVAAYHRLLESPDAGERERAARAWCDWEDAVVSVDPDHPPNPRYDDPRFRLCFARIVTHYFHHKAWLEDGELLRNASQIAGIPAVLIHGRLDFGAPLTSAWEPAQAWPSARLVVVENAGHEMRTPGMAESIVNALNEFAGSPP